jgi:DNA-binding XRE family transcriptional regulator
MNMSFGKNLQFLRRMHNSMTQEELAGIMNVSRQTISKWESDMAYPEMEKAIELCNYFSCPMDRLMREDMNVASDAYSQVRIERVPSFRYVRYAVVSSDPEGDSIRHMKMWAENSGLLQVPGYSLNMIGWDFPVVSQRQINVFHMHGYASGCILPEGFNPKCEGEAPATQKDTKYAVITIRQPFTEPFELIPNAYKTIMAYMEINGLKHKKDEDILWCFEKTYTKDEIEYMDVYIAIED